ncbi:MAG: sigma-70 family RNA polymerase sigma factor [Anaerotignum sp.]|nr:sigma-70 family RNA polymerase sigma factor [Anaerotignum sp.]
MTYEDLHDVVLLHGKSIYSFCRHLTENAADADDLYQETFLKAAELCHKINKSQNPRAFLIRIAAGIWRNSLRKEAGRRKILPFSSLSDGEEAVSPEQPPETALLQREESELLSLCAKRLKPKLRLPLYMYYTAELSLSEIASILHVPVGTVKSRLWRAKQELKHDLEVHGYET